MNNEATLVFYHISFILPPGQTTEAVQRAIDPFVVDWMRYTDNCYIVWTHIDARVLAGAVMTASIEVFVVTRMDLSDAYAYLPPWAWEWFNRDRSLSSPQVKESADVTKSLAEILKSLPIATPSTTEK